MAVIGIRWTTHDRYRNEIYLIHERWQHIIALINHPDMANYEEYLKATIRYGVRKQDSLNPQKYRYVNAFADLPADNTHITAIVLFRFREGSDSEPIPTLCLHSIIKIVRKSMPIRICVNRIEWILQNPGSLTMTGSGATM